MGEHLQNFLITLGCMAALGVFFVLLAMLFSWWVAWTVGDERARSWGEDQTADGVEVEAAGGVGSKNRAAVRRTQTHTGHETHPEHDGGAR